MLMSADVSVNISIYYVLADIVELATVPSPDHPRQEMAWLQALLLLAHVVDRIDGHAQSLVYLSYHPFIRPSIAIRFTSFIVSSACLFQKSHQQSPQVCGDHGKDARRSRNL